MPTGVIVKALSGFYYVSAAEGGPVACRARGRFRREGISPLVGDRVSYTRTESGGVIDEISPRRTVFVRPAVANIDLLVILAAAVNPVTDPYLIDRVAVIAAHVGCELLLCINKADLDPGDGLYAIYERSGLAVLRTSAVTGQGLSELRRAIAGKASAFTGNSGVGKSSVLNALDAKLHIAVGEVSEKLGRGRHTTRHVEFFDLGDDTYIADTPGFASFDTEQMEKIEKEELQHLFPEFEPHLGGCRFLDCAHLQEPDCAVLAAVEAGDIHPSRHASYARLYELAARRHAWEFS